MPRTTRSLTRSATATATAVALVVLAAALLLGASGCSYFTADTPAKEAAPKLATAGATVSGDLGAAYPASLPIWEGAKVVSAQELGDNVYELTLTTTDAFDEVVYGVGKGLEAGGFTVETLDDSASSSMIMASSDSVSALYTITAGASGGETTIVISADLNATVVNQ